jgi:hypothetical protein
MEVLKKNPSENFSFDVFIPVAPKDYLTINLCLDFIYKNLGPRKIIVVSNIEIKNYLINKEYICTYDEDNLIDGLSSYSIKKIIKTITGSEARSNWYFQQFLKMAYAFKAETKHYLIWDSDTFPLNNITFINSVNKQKNCLRYFFAMKKEYHLPYFEIIDKIFDGKVIRSINKSFIAEHMLIDKSIMIEMIQDIENNNKLSGKRFYEKILYSIDKKEVGNSGFSEFETYGNYLLTYYPDKFSARKLRTFRYGFSHLNKSDLNLKTLNWISSSYDTISFEEHYKGDRPNAFNYKMPHRFFIKYKIIPFKLFKIIIKRKK